MDISKFVQDNDDKIREIIDKVIKVVKELL